MLVMVIATVELIIVITRTPIKLQTAAMIMAALAADGVSEITEISHIERGYEDIAEKLRGLGADIRRIEQPDRPMRRAQ